jgi:hydroxymethylglutaryl-CoA reductase
VALPITNYSSPHKLRDLPVFDRAAALGLSESDVAALRAGLTLDQADHMIENVIGTYALPVGVAQNFVVNGRAIPAIPMVVEEASIVAACSYAAKLARVTGGFSAGSSAPIMIGQIQVLDVPYMEAAKARITAEADGLIHCLNHDNPSTRSKHAKAVGLEIRELEIGDWSVETSSPPWGRAAISNLPSPTMLIIHVLYDCGDAMGANLVNTACEALAPRIERLTGGRVNLRILSNLSNRRMAWASCTINAMSLLAQNEAGQSPIQDPKSKIANSIVEASLFAELDPYRAATHNKGIMNGIDAVVLATGNDWRAVEAGAHAYAARSGRYTALATWRANADGDLVGRIELPLAVGIVGGATRVHPGAQVALKLLGVQTARQLAEIMACVGLAQNFAAIRALAMEGIQHGHMALHAQQVAAAAGATGDDVERVAAQLIVEKNVRLERAKAILHTPQSPA